MGHFHLSWILSLVNSICESGGIPPDSQIEFTRLRIQDRWKWPIQTEGLYRRSLHQDPANRWDQNGSDDQIYDTSLHRFHFSQYRSVCVILLYSFLRISRESNGKRERERERDKETKRQREKEKEKEKEKQKRILCPCCRQTVKVYQCIIYIFGWIFGRCSLHKCLTSGIVSMWRMCVHALEWNPHWKLFFHSFRSATSPKCSSPEWPGGRKTLKDWRSCRWKGGSLNTVFLCFFFFFQLQLMVGCDCGTLHGKLF